MPVVVWMDDRFCSYDPAKDTRLHALSYRIRLAHKYGVDDLLKQSLDELQKQFPINLNKWDALAPTYTPRAITAVNLARLTETHAVLPSALYACCQLPEDVLRAGTTHPDGTRETLGHADLARCLAMRAQLCKKNAGLPGQVFLRERCRCGREACPLVIDRLCARAVAHAEEPEHRADVLMRWERFARAANGVGTCGECEELLFACIRARRMFYWRCLPEWMGVGPVSYWDA